MIGHESFNLFHKLIKCVAQLSGKRPKPGQFQLHRITMPKEVAKTQII